MSDFSSNLDLISAGQASKEVTANDLFDAGSPATLGGRRATTTGGMTWGYYGGVLQLNSGSLLSIPNGTKLLTDDATNYIELDPSDGSVDVNTSGWSAGKRRLYEVEVISGLVTDYTDWRTSATSGGAGDSTPTGTIAASHVTMADDGNYYGGSPAPTVEEAMQEIGAFMDAPAIDADDVAVTDTGGYFAGADVEAVLQEIGAELATLSGTTDIDTDVVFTSDTGSTADSDPGNGLFKWNNATQASATVLYFDNQTTSAVSMATFFAALAPDGFIHIAQNDDASKWQLWKWLAVVAGAGYYKFTASLMANGGSVVDDKPCSVSFKSIPPAAQPFDVAAFLPGLQTAASQIVYRGKVARAVAFAANFSGSQFTATANATGSTVFDVQKNGVSIGSVTIGAGGITPTFATSGGAAQNFAAGDVFAIIGPASADATLANSSFTFAGTR